jgi:hypothetical protein
MIVSSSAALPRRLRALVARSERAGVDTFGDWRLSRRAPLTILHPADEAAIVEEAGARFLPFAGSFSGGVLCLDVEGPDIERVPVVEFDSEGGITVLGESCDDFLALLASAEPDDKEDAWTASASLRGAPGSRGPDLSLIRLPCAPGALAVFLLAEDDGPRIVTTDF